MTGIIKTDKIQSPAGNDAVTVASNGSITTGAIASTTGTFSSNVISQGNVNAAGSGTAGGFHFADGNAMIFRDGNDMSFKLQGAQKIRLLSGGGLTFNGDTAAANALDDYEEGTWTAAFTAASGSITINASSGVYTKIGRQVTVSGAFSVGSVSSPSGDMGMTGLPFASASGAGFSTAATIWLNTINSQASKTIQARMDGNNSQFFIFDLADGNASGASAYFKANSIINVSLTYFTA